MPSWPAPGTWIRRRPRGTTRGLTRGGHRPPRSSSSIRFAGLIGIAGPFPMLVTEADTARSPAAGAPSAPPDRPPILNPSRSATGEIARGPSADATKATGSAVPASAQDLDPTPVQENDARPDARRPQATDHPALFRPSASMGSSVSPAPSRCSPEADTARSSRSAGSCAFAARSSPPGHTLLALAVAHLLGLGTRSGAPPRRCTTP